MRHTTPGCNYIGEIVTYFHNQLFFCGARKGVDSRCGNFSVFHVVASCFCLILGDYLKNSSILKGNIIRYLPRRRRGGKRTAANLPVVFEGRNCGSIFGAFHTIDGCKTDAVGIVVTISSFTREIYRKWDLF